MQRHAYVGYVFVGDAGAHLLRGKNHMPYFDVRVLKIDEPLASCLAGFPKKGRPAVRRAGARGQRLSLVVVVVVLVAAARKVFEE